MISVRLRYYPLPLTHIPTVDEYEAKTGVDIPIHVDGASGAFTAPFAYPDHQWAFDVKRVNSINASGHKFGLTYAGLGWLVIKDESLLPKVRLSRLPANGLLMT